MILYDYYRSTASYRVRIACNIKSLDYKRISVHLVKNGGEQHSPSYLQINPQGLVPTLNFDEVCLSQSLAIIEYLEEKYPDPAILPKTPKERAIIRMLAQMIASDIHPLNNLRVLNRLKAQFNANEEEIVTWYHHWLKEGFMALERHLEGLERSHWVCYGDQVTMADICLIPQVYNAKRYELPMSDFPLIKQINDYCLSLEAFYKAAPEHYING